MTIERDREILTEAIRSDDAKSAAAIVSVLHRWCHEGCTIDGHSVGVCSIDAPHDGTVGGMRDALRIVATGVINQIDEGAEGC